MGEGIFLQPSIAVSKILRMLKREKLAFVTASAAVTSERALYSKASINRGKEAI